MQLAEGSDLVDAGQNVGLSFSGTAPEIGAFEIVPTASLTFTFNGNGNWNDDANWLNAAMPPAVVNTGNQIIINPIEGGQCLLNIPYTVAPGAVLTVMPGKTLIVPGSLIITQ